MAPPERSVVRRDSGTRFYRRIYMEATSLHHFVLFGAVQAAA
jgi:hypothetical protein